MKVEYISLLLSMIAAKETQLNIEHTAPLPLEEINYRKLVLDTEYMKKLLSFDEASNLNIIETQKLYSKFISKQFTKFLNYFPYGTDEAKHSEGMYIYLEDGKKILDITGGNGVLGLGHNHPRILNVRNKFNSKKISWVVYC